jgi:hypothetical protein
VSVDLPDRGAVTVMAASAEKLPPPVPLAAGLEGESTLQFQAQTSPAGLVYYTCEQRLTIVLTSSVDRPLRTFPMVRLAGAVLPVTAEGYDDWPVLVPPNGRVTLALQLHLPRAAEGEHLLQLLFLEDPVRRLTTWPVTLSCP